MLSPAVDVILQNLGRRLRMLRRARLRTLEELAADTGLTPGYLSQIETGKAVPSLAALTAIAAALGADMTAFFPLEGSDGVRVSRAGDPDRLRIAPSSREEYTVLSTRGPTRAMTALVSRYDPEDSVGGPYTQLGERFALVLSGSLRFRIDDEDREVGPGDYLHFSSHPEQSALVTSEDPAEVLWLVAPPLI